MNCKSQGRADPAELIPIAQGNDLVSWASPVAFLLLVGVMTGSGCGTAPDETSRIEPVYSQTTGRLELLKYDADGDGTVDTWSYMDGARVLRIELDGDQDSRIDRWEYYGPDQQIEKIGVSTKPGGRADRFEYYENGVLTRAEGDTNGDGRIDKWEVYDGPRLASVSFDTTQRGSPDRRVVYGPDRSARLELLP